MKRKKQQPNKIDQPSLDQDLVRIYADRPRLKAIYELVGPFVFNTEFESICRTVLDDERFIKWPGSLGKHHSWEGGLADHTLEVIRGSLAACSDPKCKDVNRGVVAVAALWHDYGKIFDYVKNENDDWVASSHYHRVHHLVRSYHEWMKACSGLPEYCSAFVQAVSHCILVHHGEREAGSPIIPQTKEAWAVHLGDMISVHVIEERKNPRV